MDARSTGMVGNGLIGNSSFGADRCMFESNFPVDVVSCRYTVLWNSFKRLTAGYSTADKAKLFHDTAARVYRLA